MMNKILFKAIGSSEIGLGHISRITSLICKLPSNWSYVFHINDNSLVKNFLTGKNIRFVFHNAIQVLRENKFHRIIYDQLILEEDFLSEAKRQGISLMGGLDFFFYDRDWLDVIVNLFNQNFCSQNPSIFGTRYYEGLKYAIISDKFNPQLKKKEFYSFKKALIMYGGADPNKNTQKTLLFLNTLSEQFEINLIIGPLNPHKEEIMHLVGKSHHTINVFENPKQIAKIMSSSDMAFTGCGTTCFELGYLGIPSIVVAQNIQEQRLAGALHNQKVILAGDDLAHCWEEIRRQQTRMDLSYHAQQLFDGKGQERIFSCFEIF